ncbi:hypothetical protein OIU76_017624 [Salix suchowensis]|nr:hypothetical protein OIU76_017624 [Salix suchowensis]
MNTDSEAYRSSIDQSDTTSQSLEMSEFSVVDIIAQQAILRGHENADNSNARNSRLSDVRKESVIKGIPVEDGQTDKLKYEAESPEEVAFLIASQEFGFQFFQRTQSLMTLKELDPSSGKQVKSIIFDRLAENGGAYLESTTSHLSNYAEDGFRTLAFAYRALELAEYEEWNSIFTQARTTVGPEREELLEHATEMIEKELILLGVVAVEDKLQKGIFLAGNRLRSPTFSGYERGDFAPD